MVARPALAHGPSLAKSVSSAQRRPGRATPLAIRFADPARTAHRSHCAPCLLERRARAEQGVGVFVASHAAPPATMPSACSCTRRLRDPPPRPVGPPASCPRTPTPHRAASGGDSCGPRPDRDRIGNLQRRRTRGGQAPSGRGRRVSAQIGAVAAVPTWNPDAGARGRVHTGVAGRRASPSASMAIHRTARRAIELTRAAWGRKRLILQTGRRREHGWTSPTQALSLPVTANRRGAARTTARSPTMGRCRRRRPRRRCGRPRARRPRHRARVPGARALGAAWGWRPA